MRTDVAKRITLLDPFERASRNFKRLFEISCAIKRLADPVFDVVANPQVVRVEALMHVHGYDTILFPRQGNNLIGLRHMKAHRLFRNDMRPALKRSEDDFSVQVIRRSDGHDIQIWKIPKDLQPGLLAKVSFGRVAGPFLEILLNQPRRFFGSSRHRSQLEPDRREVSAPMIQPHSPELRRDAGPLQVSVSPRVNVATEHPRAD